MPEHTSGCPCVAIIDSTARTLRRREEEKEIRTPGAPAYRTGKICYIEIPAKDVGQSADFYARAFGWQVRQRADGSTAFDDAVNEVSGSWILGRPPASEPGLLVYIMVGDATATVDAVLAAGGEIVQPVDPNGDVIFATFRDPAGNVLGIYQQPGLADAEGKEAGQAPPGNKAT